MPSHIPQWGSEWPLDKVHRQILPIQIDGQELVAVSVFAATGCILVHQQLWVVRAFSPPQSQTLLIYLAPFLMCAALMLA